MWPIMGKPIDVEKFSPFEPLRVLSFCDDPRIFTLRGSGDLHLACWSDESEDRSRFLVVPTTDRVVFQLESNAVTVREALCRSELYVVEVGQSLIPDAVWLVDRESVPQDAQPQPGVFLHRLVELAIAPIGVTEAPIIREPV